MKRSTTALLTIFTLFSILVVSCAGTPQPAEVEEALEAEPTEQTVDDCELYGMFLKNYFDFAEGSLAALEEILSKEMGCQIHLSSGESDRFPYIFETGEADFALVSFDNLPLFDTYNLTPIALTLFEESFSFYKGAFFTNIDSPVESLLDCEGQSFGYYDTETMHSYHFPRAILHLEGFDINTFFSETVMIGLDIFAMVEAVRNGTVDVGVVYASKDSDFLQDISQGDPAVLEELKIFDYTPWIPVRGIVASPAIDIETQNRLANALVAASNSPAGKDALFGIDEIRGFVPPDDSFMEMMELVRLAIQLDEDFGTW